MIREIVGILLPPASIATLAMALLLTRARAARALGLCALAVFIALGTPLASDWMLSRLSVQDERRTPGEATAIVVLSADGVRVAETPDLEPGMLTLERMRVGARLAKRTGLPVLTSGGRADGAATTLAQMMKASLRDDFGVRTRWTEDESADTWENAAYSARILRQAGIGKVYLVTHAWHMPRALKAFRKAGIDAVPVPVHPVIYGFAWTDLIPTAHSWYRSYLAIHEITGLTYYRMRDPPARTDPAATRGTQGDGTTEGVAKR